MAKRALSLIWLGVLVLGGCQSAEKRRENQIDGLAARYKHLSGYREIQCNLKVKFAEPAKSAWLAQLFGSQHEGVQGSNSRVFSVIESTPFSWRSTPYRCQVTPFRIDESGTAVRQVMDDVNKRLNTVMCIWMQSFYADSPLRGWRKGEGQLGDKGGALVIDKGEGRRLEFKDQGKKATAHFGEGSSLNGQFEELGGKLYPTEIELAKGEDRSRISDIVYEPMMDRELPRSFWFYAPSSQGHTSAYMQVAFEQCRWN